MFILRFLFYSGNQRPLFQISWIIWISIWHIYWKPLLQSLMAVTGTIVAFKVIPATTFHIFYVRSRNKFVWMHKIQGSSPDCRNVKCATGFDCESKQGWMFSRLLQYLECSLSLNKYPNTSIKTPPDSKLKLLHQCNDLQG